VRVREKKHAVSEDKPLNLLFNKNVIEDKLPNIRVYLECVFNYEAAASA
jgi:hypothetical protein